MTPFIVTLILTWLPALVYAASDVHNGHAAPTAAQWKLLGFTVANFAIFLFVMRWAARTPLRDFLANRRRQVVASMAEAARLKEEAECLKRDYEAKAAQLDQARADLIAEIRSIAEADRARALVAAAEAAERLRRDAERTAQSDLERAREELRAEAALLAQQLAVDEVRRRLTDDDRRRLLAEFLSKVNK